MAEGSNEAEEGGSWVSEVSRYRSRNLVLIIILFIKCL